MFKSRIWQLVWWIPQEFWDASLSDNSKVSPESRAEFMGVLQDYQISLYDQVFHWRLPLASLLPKKIDSKTHEEFPGNFDFNPYTGGKLSAQ